MEAADDVETEGVERSDPHGSCSLWLLAGDPFGHLARRLVGEGKQQDAARIDPIREQAFDPRDQRLRLACAGTCFEKIGFAAM